MAFLFGPIFLRLKREMVDLEQTMRLWEVSWARGRHFHVLVVAAFVCKQREPIMKVPVNSATQLFQLFGRLHGTQYASPLLVAARKIESQSGVLNAVEEVMGTMGVRSIV